MEPSGRKRRTVLCKCKCGKELLVRVDSLFSESKKHNRKSCGCTKNFINGINAQSRRKPESVYRFLDERYKNNAKSRNLNFELTRTDYDIIINFLKKLSFDVYLNIKYSSYINDNLVKNDNYISKYYNDIK